MSASASQLGFAVSRVTALRASKPTERRDRALHVTPIRCHVGTQSTDGASEVTRRGALRAAAAAAVLAVATPRSALAGDNVVSFEPVQNERWVAVPLSTKIPGGWNRVPNGGGRTSFYTDTYGPNYRFFLATSTSTATAVAARRSRCRCSRGRSGDHHGPRSNRRPRRAPRRSASKRGHGAGGQVSAAKRVDSGAQPYCQWELALPSGSRV